MSERKSKNIFLIVYVSLMVLLLLMSSCGSSKGCDGKKKFKTEMN